MRVADVMQSRIVTVSPETTLPVLERVMHEHGVREVPVVDDGLVLGIVCANDVGRRETTLDRRAVTTLLDRVTAGDIMRRPVIVVEPSRALDEAVRVMRAERISALPVTRAGRLVGLLTESDVLAALRAGGWDPGQLWSDAEDRQT